MSFDFAAMIATILRSYGMFFIGFLLLSTIETSIAFVPVPSTTYKVRPFKNIKALWKVDPIVRNHESFVVRVASKSGDEDNEEPLFYDDFADFIPGGGDVGEPFLVEDMQENKGDEAMEREEVEMNDEKEEEEESELTRMLQKGQMQEMERNERISRNWSQGNWKCRGFSLDKSNYNVDTSIAKQGATTVANSTIAVNEEKSTTSASSTTKEGPPIHVSQIAFDETSIGGKFGEIAEVIAVGRTDGSVFLVQLGSEYLTRFTAVPKLSWEDEDDNGDGKREGGGNSMKIETELVNDKEMQERIASQMSGIQGADALDIPYLDQDTSTSSSMPPFEIQCQFQAHEKNEAISALLYHDDTLFTGCTSGMIKMWRIDEFHDRMQMIPAQNLNIHQDKVVVFKTLSSKGNGNDGDVMSHDLLLSASLDGSFALWDKGGDLVYRCQMVDDDGLPTSITSADVDTSGDEHIIYFGLSSGKGFECMT